MAVTTPQVEINPYTSQVPLIQMPPQEAEAGSRPASPLPGEFGKKGTGAIAIGDSILKGFMQGHQIKEQRKYAEAATTIAAADAATSKAWDDYQNALTQAHGKVNDPKAQGAYQTYTGIFNAGKQAKAKFVIPEKTQKGMKAVVDTDPVRSPDDKKKKNPVSAGFNNIKDFFEANPHIIPQIALLTMQPNKPGLTPQNQVQTLDLQRAQEQEKTANIGLQKAQQVQADQNMIAMYGRLTPEEIKGLPSDVQAKINDPQNGLSTAKARYAMEQPAKEKFDWFVDERGDFHPVPIGADPLPGWKKYEKPSAAMSDPGSKASYYTKWAAEHNKTVQQMTDADIDAADAERKSATAQNSSTTSSLATDQHGNRTTTTSRKVTPAGGITAPPQQGKIAGKIASPPAAPTPKTGTGKMAAAPTLTDVNRTAKVNDEKATRYQKASTALTTAKEKNLAAYNKAIASGMDQATAKAAQDAADKLAQDAYDAEGAEIQKWYADQVRSAGGRMPTDLPEAARSQLKAGFVTTFGNGQQWTLDANGQPKLISQGK